MRIAIIVGDAVGGIRKHVHEILEHLILQADDVVYCLSTSVDSRGSSEIDGFLKQRGVVLQKFEIVKAPSFKDLFVLRQMFQFLKENYPDVIHCHGAKGGLYGRVLGLLLKVPVIYTPHGGALHNSFGLLKGSLFLGVERLLSRLTSLFVFESNYSKTQFVTRVLDLPREKFIVNFNGIAFEESPKDYSWTSSLPLIRLVCVGLLRHEKGQDYAVRVVAELKNSGYDVRLNLVGGGDQSDLRVLAQELGVMENVSFSGDVLAPLKYMQEADLVLIPSRFESFGYVGLEALSVGRPIVAFDVGGLREVLSNGESGYLVPAGHVDSMAKTCVLALKNQQTTREKIEYGRYTLRTYFSRERALNQLHASYNNLIQP